MLSANEVDFDLEFQNEIGEDQDVYREITFSEIMAYQHPKYFAYIGFVASVFASLQLPLFGFVLSRFIFLLDDDI